MFYADLHIHSKYSRATSRNADLEHMAIWACKKGVSVLGTGDFTHPAWLAEIQEKLVPAEPGLFRLRDDLQREVDRQVSGPCNQPVRFMLEVEISTIYKKGEKTRKVHHLIYVPDLEKAGRLIEQLSRIGNLKSDGRPILGLDSRDLLEITLESGPGCYLVPAHIWTPWFAALGSKSGFDSIDDCYGDLASHIFAVETGLSSDPPMNWRLSSLDGYQLVSNSDAHSPPKIGREACAFECDLDYFSMRQALETGSGYRGTVEFFPEEGKYHMDGHRKCGIRLSPRQTREHEGLCPECGKSITVGVMSRVDELADRTEDFVPPQPTEYRSLIPLSEVIAEIRGVGEKSKRVQSAYEELIAKIGSELCVLQQLPIEDIRAAGAPVVAEAVSRMRDGHVIREAGYDGEYGRIHLFEPGEIAKGDCVSLLFEMPEQTEAKDEGQTAACLPNPTEDAQPAEVQSQKLLSADNASSKSRGAHVTDDSEVGGAVERRSDGHLLVDLDRQQRSAAESIEGPLLIIAGPGTGKTRTLTHRIAHIVQDHGVSPEKCLAITFSRRAAEEMSKRLSSLLPDCGEDVPVMTFHALGLSMLRENASIAGLPKTFRVAGRHELSTLLVEMANLSERKARSVLREFSRAKRLRVSADPSGEKARLLDAYQDTLKQRGLVDFDDLILMAVQLLGSHADLSEHYRNQWPWISIDEFQDIDDAQYELITKLAVAHGNVCAIGDPDQSIYGFRGADARSFERFSRDFPSARTVHLTRNYRSSRVIVDAAMQAIAPSSLVENRQLHSDAHDERRIEIQSCPTEGAEAEFVVHAIERLIGGSTFFSLDSGRVDQDQEEALSFNDIGVLYRTDAQADVLCEAFSRSGIPFQKKSHSSLIDQPAVSAMVRAIQREAAASDAANQHPLSAVERLKQAADKNWEKYPDATDWLQRLHPLAEQHGNDATGFCNHLTMGVDVDLWDPRADRVSLLTLHAAKGLEFAVVFLVGCEDQLLPLRWGAADETDTEEERRLFFVGITRAKNRLFISHAAKRQWRGKVRCMEPSSFLTAIQEELLQRGQSRSIGRRKNPNTQLELF